MHKLLFPCVLILVACQPVTVQRTENLVPVSVRVDDAAFWLEEWQRTLELPEGQQTEVLEKREQAFIKSRGARNRLRLALLLVAGPEQLQDRDRALKLLENMDYDEASHSAQALATLLVKLIGEQRASSGKIRSLDVRLARSQERIQELEQQLQALTDIEQNIQNREQTSPEEK